MIGIPTVIKKKSTGTHDQSEHIWSVSVSSHYTATFTTLKIEYEGLKVYHIASSNLNVLVLVILDVEREESW